MQSPLHRFLQDMIQEKTAESGADKLQVLMTADNATVHCPNKPKRSRNKQRRKGALDISDHTKGMSRWEAVAS
ncbi:MAG: hypothetical protein SGBAC_004683 [Bacillariaceae sp.]